MTSMLAAVRVDNPKDVQAHGHMHRSIATLQVGAAMGAGIGPTGAACPERRSPYINRSVCEFGGRGG